MVYIVQMHHGGASSSDATSTTVSSRQEALTLAAKWQAAGREVKIIGDGRVYHSVSGFALTIISESPQNEKAAGNYPAASRAQNI
jgi:hypothetical protein